jgi:selenocysteine lyase/cysteine desulfurase
MSETKSFYSHFLGSQSGKLHFAAHSHHFWPDVSRAGHLEAWEDAALMNDAKWEKIFNTVIPRFQQHLAKMLQVRDHTMIALAPNTHDLLIKVFSPLLQKPLRVLTTDSEFYSFSRQLRRWEEVHHGLKVTRVSTENFLTASKAFYLELAEKARECDVLFISQVFFNSGLALDLVELKRIIDTLAVSTVVIIDGYHATGAIPTDLSELEGRVYYLGGGYKYLQAGEGAGFMLAPRNELLPTLTGWFAEFADLSNAKKGSVPFAENGMKYWGSTFDPCAWYRFNAVWDFFEKMNLNVDKIHQQIREYQLFFIQHLPAHSLLERCQPLFSQSLDHHGHFLTFRASSLEEGAAIEETLKERGVTIDRRGDRLRFGFGLYQDRTDILSLINRLKLNT